MDPGRYVPIMLFLDSCGFLFQKSPIPQQTAASRGLKCSASLQIIASREGISDHKYMGVSNNEEPFLGVPIVRIIAHWGPFWGPLLVETSTLGRCGN